MAARSGSCRSGLKPGGDGRDERYQSVARPHRVYARADPASGARAPKMICKFVTPAVCKVIEPLLVLAQRLANHVEFVFGEGHAGDLRGSGLAGGCVLLNYRQPVSECCRRDCHQTNPRTPASSGHALITDWADWSSRRGWRRCDLWPRPQVVGPCPSSSNWASSAARTSSSVIRLTRLSGKGMRFDKGRRGDRRDREPQGQHEDRRVLAERVRMVEGQRDRTERTDQSVRGCATVRSAASWGLAAWGG